MANDFRVNTTTVGGQYSSLATALPNGRFVVVWEDRSESPYIYNDIRGQVFNADGSKSGNEFLVNTTTDDFQVNLSIATLSDGRFVVTWEDQGYGDDVRAQIFNPNATKYGSEFVVNTSAYDQTDPAITALPDGRFVVTWDGDGDSIGDPSICIHGQIFNANGSKSGNEFLVSSTTATTIQYEPDITTLSDGRFAITWLGDGVHAQVFNADGTKYGNELRVDSSPELGQYDPVITALSSGGFVVTWTDDSSDTDDDFSWDPNIHAQIFNANGSKSGGNFIVNTVNTDRHEESSVTALANGRFVVAWKAFSDIGGDTSSSAIHAQVFNNNGSKSGSEFLVNTTTYEAQEFPDITTLSDGRFIVNWSDYGPNDGDSNYSVRARIFNSDGTPYDSALVKVGDSGNNTLLGASGNDILNGLAGNDKLFGLAGNDTLIGGLGNDIMYGGSGNDRYYVNTTGDIITEAVNAGWDAVVSDASFTLSNNLEKLILSGSAAINGIGNSLGNVLIGNSGANILNGLAGNDSMSGGAGNDKYYVNTTGDIIIETVNSGWDTVIADTSFTLSNNLEKLILSGSAAINGSGNNLGNILNGNSAANILNGLAGNDILFGGAGNDSFLFNTALNSTQNIDIITDFSHVDDTIQLDRTIFSKFTTLGALSSSNFKASTTGLGEANDYILYNTKTGVLTYDTDGSGAGMAVQFAVLSYKPQNLSYNDFVIVA